MIENKNYKYKTFFELIEEFTNKPNLNYIDNIRLYYLIVKQINIYFYSDELFDMFQDLELLLGLSMFDDDITIDENYVLIYSEHLKEVVISEDYKIIKSYILSIDFEI